MSLDKGFFSLNKNQRDAAEHIHGPLLILAGAGTGKTRVITTRIAGMLYNNINPSNILAVTFTNKASNEMRERVYGMVDRKIAKEVTISTFHSLCVKILRTGIENIGYKKNFTIYTQGDQLSLLKQIILKKASKNESMDANLAKVLISKSKNSLSPIDISEDSLISEVYYSYQSELKQLNAVDFDDLLLLAVKVLEENKDASEVWREKCKFIMVDEFQDTNKLQMMLLNLLVNKENNICVVGDDDQSIYGWRGADVSNILKFEYFFPNSKIIKLEENYRSTNSILNLANSLISNNKNRRDKTLWSNKSSGEKCRIVCIPTPEIEAEWVINEIIGCHKIDRRNYKDIAILFRINSQSKLIEEKLRENDIPYKLIGGQSFYEKREIKDIISYLKLFLNPDDDISLLRVISTPARGIGKGTVSLATQFSIDNNISIFDAFNTDEFVSKLSVKSQNKIECFCSFIHKYSDKFNSKFSDYASNVKNLILDIEYDSHLKKTCKSIKESDKRRENVMELIQNMENYFNFPKRTLQKFIDNISLDNDKKNNETNDIEGVSLITMHASKGLEFPVCFMVGIEEGILPHFRSKEEDNKSEERRLFYVGITRAMEELTISWCSKRKKYGEDYLCQPSSFFKELNKKELIMTDYDKLSSEPADKDYGSDYFDNIISMLSD